MRETRPSGSEGGGTLIRPPYPYQVRPRRPQGATLRFLRRPQGTTLRLFNGLLECSNKTSGKLEP